MPKKKSHLIFSAIALSFLFVFNVIWFGPEATPDRPVEWGLNFSQSQAEYLGLDWREAYQATLNDLNAKNYRLSAYWSRIEPRPDQFDFRELDYLLGEAHKNNAQILLAVGAKLPRWPECHLPDWAMTLGPEELSERVLIMLEKVVTYSRQYPNIVAWQVENESLLDFGQCPKTDHALLVQEVQLVRELDARPILMTESGELSSWTRLLGTTDLLGISLYRTVWNKWFGVIRYPLTPSFYNRHKQSVSPWLRDMWITELQAEPWGPKPIMAMSKAELDYFFNQERLQSNINFAKKTHFKKIFLWGSEYWYFLKKNGDDRLWQTVAKTLAR